MPYLNASTKKRNVNIWMFPSPKPNSTLSLLFLHSLFQWIAPHAPQQSLGIILRAFNWEWGLPPIPDFLLFFTNSCQFFSPTHLWNLVTSFHLQFPYNFKSPRLLVSCNSLWISAPMESILYPGISHIWPVVSHTSVSTRTTWRAC